MSNFDIPKKDRIPPRWLNCPRKSLDLIGGKFLAFKTPLDSKYDSQVDIGCRFTPDMVFNSMKSYKVKIGLWIDLCNTSRFYDKEVVKENGCRYEKLKCRGHGEAPSEEQVNQFIIMCKTFAQQHPLEAIAVHCTHGFNRTGFLIASYLIVTEDWSPEAALGTFAKSRQPGIYKQDYIDELFRRFGDVSDAPAAPELPDWCYEDENGLDDDGNAIDDVNESRNEPSSSRRREKTKKNPTFMAGVPGVSVVKEQPLLSNIQRKVQDMCDWNKSGFPGAQPVSMDRENMQNLAKMPYKVSWKADGTRYMMLIDGKDQIYFIDRDNCVFQVHGMTFLKRKEPEKHLKNTLLDGEMVIDEVGNVRTPRYLVYDIIRFEGEEVGKTIFGTRLICIEKEIIQTRSKHMQEGRIDKASEPFSVRQKQFWPITHTATLLGPKFTKASLGHEPDGLIFQPSKLPYTPGRDDNILKWKPDSHNSVDFKLQVVVEDRPGMLKKSMGYLFVGGFPNPFSQIRLTKELKQLNNRIIECTWNGEKNCWEFMRERTDKSYPNGYATAQGVIKSIREPVTEHMLLELISQIEFRQPPPPPRPHHDGDMGPPTKRLKT